MNLSFGLSFATDYKIPARRAQVIIPLLVIFGLHGCASGKIMGDSPDGSPKLTHIKSATQQSFGIRPLWSDADDSTTLDMKGVWVSEGWFQFEYACFSPKNNPHLIVISESNDHKVVFIKGGQQLMVQCDPDVLEQVDFLPATGE